ncbi:MAG TPA: MarR family winged helix-turn-helix transcriptional regulator [Actinophytocola sp.]|uniref:MarR family winged helix-turn-helix transcriptional regulator n=1 Tax=Actinophytocola sp. TaxID=1872138 RepID=UPI002DDDB942|nr:MarR family winged helix-turn-helix transcriptional regulator [Actinophytocola sp.]HEV2784090.1 MarR family winged helix-turn-helix transcriptional regulator [Actinophytocola sp.]
MGTVAPTEVEHDLMFLLSQASHVLQTELTAALTGLGVSPRHYCVLSHAMAGDLSQIRLAELCGLDKTTMVVTMDELEKAGLAERRPSATDRRARIVAVTEAGEEMVAKAHDVVAGIYADVLAALPDGDREGFVNGLELLVRGRLSTPVHCDRVVRRRSPKA